MHAGYSEHAHKSPVMSVSLVSRSPLVPASPVTCIEGRVDLQCMLVPQNTLTSPLSYLPAPCRRASASSAGSGGSGYGSSEGSWRGGALTCPTCGAENKLPPRGILGLPPDYVLQHRLVLASLNKDVNQLLCDLCTSDSPVSGSLSCSVLNQSCLAPYWTSLVLLRIEPVSPCSIFNQSCPASY
uniref:(California timema) hypothetical protein n=1 Tax=Timema californicum TaxID=61474 RepID=A0A7R9P8U9_TIMCA|nr:unnamed protein product [Timema californicum]